MGQDDWKEELQQVLQAAGLVDDDYTGRIVINLNQGGVTDVEKIQKIEKGPPGD